MLMQFMPTPQIDRRTCLRGLYAGFLLAALGLSPLGEASAQEDSLRPVAVVNDRVISVLDLAMRIRLTVLGAQVENTPEFRSRITRQVMRVLIEEQLQLQEATRLQITISDEQVETALEGFAQQRNMTKDAFTDRLQRAGVLPSSFKNQIRATLAWQSVLELRLLPQVEVQDDEIDAAIEQISSRNDGLERRVAEIFLAVPNARAESEVAQNAQRMVEQIRQGANFLALARQFSQSSTRDLGGDMGWVSLGELETEIASVLVTLQPGELSRPIRTLTGFTILLLKDVRASQGAEVDRSAIQSRLTQQKLDLLARRSLQELRRSATIDIRI